jgi:hypothetical protein
VTVKRTLDSPGMTSSEVVISLAGAAEAPARTVSWRWKERERVWRWVGVGVPRGKVLVRKATWLGERKREKEEIRCSVLFFPLECLASYDGNF